MHYTTSVMKIERIVKGSERYVKKASCAPYEDSEYDCAPDEDRDCPPNGNECAPDYCAPDTNPYCMPLC